MNHDQLIMNGLYLFKALIKDGCEWRGDVCSKRWSERVAEILLFGRRAGERVS